jgi:PhoPQ-activated pathogenicity-related protein
MAAARLIVLCAAVILVTAVSARADLDEYVKKPDSSYSWKETQAVESHGSRYHEIALTSQTWRGIPWKHLLRIYEPKKRLYDNHALLFITGGSTGGTPGKNDEETGFGLAEGCGSLVAVLYQVPNQPLLDGKKEDDLIAETFTNYLKSRDEEWPLLFPMVKSAVRAIDTVQAWQDGQNATPLQFVVTGGSKRGWTTWLTATQHRRVAAIAPMVIPTLNMRAQNKHQLESWGKYSEQIADYTRRGLTEAIDTPEGTKLWHMIDPYSYKDRLTLPKFQINGSNDPYWTLDSLNIYWDELKGPKWVVYLPNAGHGLDQNRHYALQGIAAYFRHVASNRPMPELTWEHGDDDAGAPRLIINSKPAAKQAKLWTASADSRDFRQAHWTAGEHAGSNSHYAFAASTPKTGYSAHFGDITYEIDGIEYHLSTQVRIIGRKIAE